MKKILLATTVLVGTAGFAAAEVSLSGSARMGVVYNDAAENEMSFSSRARVAFGLSGETDSGLSFGASFRADNAGGANDGTSGVVFMSGAFGKISMGDTSSAAENAVGDLAEVGYTGFSAFSGETAFGLDPDSGDPTEALLAGLAFGNEFIYISTGINEMALYEYSAGDFTVMASIGQPGGGLTSYSLAAKYATDAYSVALGYEDVEDFGDHIIASASATFSGVTLEGIYGTFDGDAGGEIDQYGIGASYTAGATTIDAFYRVTDIGAADNIDAFGIGATYDLGGGAALEGGVANIDNGTADATVADIGVTFTF